MYSHILVPTDGSEVAERGIDQALALAARLGARVTFVTVTEALPSYTGFAGGGFGLDAGMVEAFEKQQAEHAQAILAKARGKAAQAGVAAEVLHVPDDFPADAIVEAAKSRAADLIVMSSHGRRGLGRLLVGSQASGVVNHSPVPVLVVR